MRQTTDNEEKNKKKKLYRKHNLKLLLKVEFEISTIDGKRANPRI